MCFIEPSHLCGIQRGNGFIFLHSQPYLPKLSHIKSPSPAGSQIPWVYFGMISCLCFGILKTHPFHLPFRAFLFPQGLLELWLKGPGENMVCGKLLWVTFFCLLLFLTLLCCRGKKEKLGKRTSDLTGLPWNLPLILPEHVPGTLCVIESKYYHKWQWDLYYITPLFLSNSTSPDLLNHQPLTANTASLKVGGTGKRAQA